MSRINPVDTKQAEGKVKALFDNVEKALGRVPNIMKTMAQSPAVLEAFLGFGKALGGGALSAKLREQIALTVAGVNSCDYCAAAHTALGRKFGLSEDELEANLVGSSDDPRIGAALEFARAIVAKQGWVSDEQVQAVRNAGYEDGEIAEIIAVVAINIFTNYFNHIARPEIDFPVVEMPQPVGV